MVDQFKNYKGKIQSYRKKKVWDWSKDEECIEKPLVVNAGDVEVWIENRPCCCDVLMVQGLGQPCEQSTT